MQILACDLSMRRPGFAILSYEEETRAVRVLEMSNIDNKTAKKPHGQMLAEIAHEFRRL